MLTPTILTAGATQGLLLITDHEGVVHRVPKANVDDVINSTNDDAYRIEIVRSSGSIILIFANVGEVTSALADIDAQY